MMKLDCIKLSTLVLGSALFFPNAELKSQEKAEKPNFLLIFADDLGYETLGCYGSEEFSTPQLDKMSTEGMRFSRVYTSPVCTPSRMSLYTGRYVSQHKYYNVLPVHTGTKQAVDFKKKFSTYAQTLRNAGYATSVTGKWQLATLEFHPEHCRDAGYDSWCVWQIWREGAKTTRYWNPCYNHDGNIRDDIADRFGPDVLEEYVIDQMKSAKAAGKPFFIHHNMLLPHIPIVETPADRKSGEKASLSGMISYMDAIVGRLIDAVDELGIAENTYIIFMGDNGTDTVNKPRKTTAGMVTGGKRTLDDGGTHIPMLVRRPGKIEAGAVADDLVDIVDWFPTLCELADVELPSEIPMDGVSFAGRLLRGEKSPRTWVTGGIGNHVSVFDGTTRLDTKGSMLDATDLPREKAVEGTSERLKAVLNEIGVNASK